MKTIVLDNKSYVLFKELLEELTEDYMDHAEYSNSCGGSDEHYIQYYGESSDEDSIVNKAQTILSKINKVEQRDIKIKSIIDE